MMKNKRKILNQLENFSTFTIYFWKLLNTFRHFISSTQHEISIAFQFKISYIYSDNFFKIPSKKQI